MRNYMDTVAGYFKAVIFCVLSAFLVCGCVTQSAITDFTPADIEGNPVFESGDDWATYTVDNKYLLINNVWNKGLTTGAYSQKVFVKDDNGKSVFGWSWQWNYAPDVVAYPEIQFGSSPWGRPTAKNTGFPFKAGSKKLTAYYTLDLNAAGTYNTAFEFWTIRNLPSVKDNIKSEVMIWISKAGRATPDGSRAGSITVNGVAYTMYMKKDHGDLSGVNQNRWSIITFVAQQPVLTGPLDVSAFIDYLLEKGIMSKDEYVACLELGNEVTSGSGNTVIRNFEITLTNQ
jgi:hypothetical protein